MNRDKYTDGLDMNQFKHIPELSYNNNYYIGFKRDGYSTADLIFGESDDDNTTYWYIISLDEGKNIPFGMSYCTNGNKLEAL